MSIFNYRYGREDEEVMGLKFCNEAIIALKQIWPPPEDQEEFSPLQVRLHYKIIIIIYFQLRVYFLSCSLEYISLKNIYYIYVDFF